MPPRSSWARLAFAAVGMAAALIGAAVSLVVAVGLLSRLGAYVYPVEHAIEPVLAPEPA